MFDQRFLAAQLNAIEKAIFLASEKAYRNLRYNQNGELSQDFIIEWIQ